MTVILNRQRLTVALLCGTMHKVGRQACAAQHHFIIDIPSSLRLSEFMVPSCYRNIYVFEIHQIQSRFLKMITISQWKKRIDHPDQLTPSYHCTLNALHVQISTHEIQVQNPFLRHYRETSPSNFMYFQITLFATISHSFTNFGTSISCHSSLHDLPQWR